MNNYEWSTAYTDLCKEIDILEMRLIDLRTDLNSAERAYQRNFVKFTASYSGMPGGSGTNIQAMDHAERLDNEIESLKETLARKKEAKRNMEKSMSEMQSIERVIAYKRDIEHKNLEVISKEIGYSYQWTRQLSLKTKRLKAG